MTKARQLADLLDASGDVSVGALDNVPPSNDASALTTGTLPVDRVPYVGRRNLIINGGFDVSQRGDFTTATSLTGTPTYHVDRWAGYDNVVSGTFTDLGKKIRLDSTSTGTGQVRIDQKIETQDILPNQTYTMSAWVKSNKSGAGIAIYNDKTSAGGDTEVYSSFHSGSGDWEYLTVTMTTHSTEPYLFFCRVALTPLGNTATSSGEYLEAKEAQLELGSVATPFEHRSYGEELALCQRYYEQYELLTSGSSKFIPMSRLNGSSGPAYYNFRYRTEKRASPSMSVTGSWNATAGYAGDPVFYVVSKDNARVASTTTVSANQVVYLSGGTIIVDAEL